MGIERDARSIERRGQEILAETEGLAARLGLVEFEVVAGEEPEEGVEFEITTAPPLWPFSVGAICE